MSKKFLFSLFLLLLANHVLAGSWIRVNQLGYLPHSTKVAVMMSEDDTHVKTFQLVDVFTGKAVYTGSHVKNMGPLGKMKSTFRLNFSDFNAAGAYCIKVGNCVSSTFAINTHVYDGTADFVLNYMRQQRCGYNPFQRDSCHIKDAFIQYHPAKDGQHIDVRGGWHDAADLLQYTATSANAIYQMMFAYQQNPDCFTDHFQANGLPGANGIPDIIDEIYWGLDWLDRMNPEKGELYNQIADDRDHIGVKMPKDDPADYGWGPRNGRPVYFVNGKPQQRGKFMNATMGAASTAGKFASDFALGSQILAPFYPQFAAKIGQKAADAYQVGIDMPGNTQTVSVVSPYIYEEDNWTDDMELAAIELYKKTGEKRYLVSAMEFGRREPITPWMGADSARHYQWYPFMNMGHYRMAEVPAAGQRLQNEFIRNYKTGIQRVYDRAQSSPFLWGVPGIWCSNNLTVALLTQCILYRQLTGDRTYEEMEGALRDWLFGCNPWGTSMIVELPKGGVYPHCAHSNWVFEGVGVPQGGLVDGPVYTTIFNSLQGVTLAADKLNREGNLFEEFQPGDVVYHDNTNDYSSNEPTMDGTASLTFPLSFYQQEGKGQEKGSARSIDRKIHLNGGIIQGDPAQKKICLVFTSYDQNDDAETIISTLRKHGVKAGFFFCGKFFDLYPKTVRQLINDGHYVGSHSYEHLLYASWDNPDSMLVTQQRFTSDMVKSYRTLAKFGITRDKAPYFIPPYEYYNSTISSWASSLGLQVINFTPGPGTNGDYTFPNMPDGTPYFSNDYLYNKLMEWESAKGLNGHLLMIHFGTSPSRIEKFYNLLDEMITNLEAKGYRFVSVEEMMR